VVSSWLSISNIVCWLAIKYYNWHSYSGYRLNMQHLECTNQSLDFWEHFRGPPSGVFFQHIHLGRPWYDTSIYNPLLFSYYYYISRSAVPLWYCSLSICITTTAVLQRYRYGTACGTAGGKRTVLLWDTNTLYVRLYASLGWSSSSYTPLIWVLFEV